MDEPRWVMVGDHTHIVFFGGHMRLEVRPIGEEWAVFFAAIEHKRRFASLIEARHAGVEMVKTIAKRLHRKAMSLEQQ